MQKRYFCTFFTSKTENRETMNNKQPNRKATGYILAAVAAATYGMNPLFTLPLYARGMDANSVLFFRYLLAIPIIAIMIRLRGRSFHVKGTDLLPLSVMGILLAVSSLSLFYSYHYMDSGLASTLLFVYPVIVAIIMAVFFREKPGILTFFCILLTLCGIGLLCKTDGGSSIQSAGLILVFTSALSYAIYIVAVNRVKRLKEMPTVKLTFYTLIASTLVFFITVGGGTRLLFPSSLFEWGCLICLALLPTVISFLATTKAVQYIGPTPTAILGSLEPVTAVFFGVLLFNESLSPRLIVGILLIIAAVTMIVAQGGITEYLIRFRKLFPKIKIRKNN